MNLATVGLEHVRPVASGPWTFISPATRPDPILCMVEERNDGELEKETRDCIVLLADGSREGAYDFELHAQGCAGPNESQAGRLRRDPCECGAFPPSAASKLRRSIAVKRTMQARTEIAAGDNVVRFTDDGRVVPVEQEIDNTPKPKRRKAKRVA